MILSLSDPSAAPEGAGGAARHGTARHGTARHGTARHGTARHGTARHGTARHGTARHGTARTLSGDVAMKPRDHAWVARTFDRRSSSSKLI
jgi:hypothetical protein